MVIQPEGYLAHYGYTRCPGGSEDYLAHAGRSKKDGAKVGSGRYPLGSGERPFQHAKISFKDKRQKNSLYRHLAADKKLVDKYQKIDNEHQQAIDAANSEYRRIAARPTLFVKKKEEELQKAADDIDKMMQNAAPHRADLNRAKKIYIEDQEELEKFIDDLNKKYGDIKISEIQYKYNKNADMNYVKTGATLANMPVIGTMYSGNYTAKREAAEREKELNERAKSGNYSVNRQGVSKSDMTEAKVKGYVSGYVDEMEKRRRDRDG